MSVMEVNEDVCKEFLAWQKTCDIDQDKLADFMEHLLDAICKGGIKEIGLDNKVYEVYADVIETRD
jgi:hypothetical protein